MKAALGVVMMIAGVAFGVYAGLWWAFIGGIVDVISAIRAPEIVAIDVAIGVAKFMFACVIGGVSGIVAAFPGYALFKSAQRRSKGLRHHGRRNEMLDKKVEQAAIKHADAQSSAKGATLTDVLAAATYTVSLKADSGYEAEETGRITSQQWGAALAVFADAEFGAMVFKMATERGG